MYGGVFLKMAKLFFLIFFALFMLPIIIGIYPLKQKEDFTSSKRIEQPMQIAMTNAEALPTLRPKKVLIYFAHPEEAYEPITLKEVGAKASSHPTSNIQSLAPIIKQQFELQMIETDLIQVNVAAELKARNLKYKDSYSMIRPYVKQALDKSRYDLIIDIHRDAVSKKITTIEYEGASFAKMALVIGSKHDNFAENMFYAEQLHHQLNLLVPSISRGVMKKGEAGSNGIYNQDLAENILLVELGGMENTEEEIVRSVAILAMAVAQLFQSESL